MSHDVTNTTNLGNGNKREIHGDVQKLAEAIEDLVYMEAIKFKDSDSQNSRNILTLSTRFTLILSNVISSLKLERDHEDDVMRSIYFSLLIYMNEQLKMPKSLTMALGNDLEKYRDEMECSELISNYVKVLLNIFTTSKLEA
ncbi:hypothetical protein [Nitrososphaera sp. AFS]|jgi:hypothetical protein|uniref:hypothetical protein n=1 Tax=Nitrososphaera sp. AFS TaxID=2301191 RepID=UPI0013922FE6|nr:hypothetical protein [Nitrososphaera sp. AFS]NAL77156.1 hypothetical protein [Nitrososphaera sp. AFS]